MIEKYRCLAAVIAAHPDHQVVGRTRLQKTVKLLQRLGAPMDYDYMIHFYGPYSEGVQSDIGLLENLGLVQEEECETQSGSTYFKLKATNEAKKIAKTSELKPFLSAIQIMSDTKNTTVLELAATYDAFRESGDDHKTASARVRRKKGTKCDDGRLAEAMKLLEQLGLEASP